MSHQNTVDTMKRTVEEVAQNDKELENKASQSDRWIEVMKARLAEIEEQNNFKDSYIEEMLVDLVD